MLRSGAERVVVVRVSGSNIRAYLRISLVSRPLQPALPRTAPPTVPGRPIQGSRPARPASTEALISLGIITPASAVISVPSILISLARMRMMRPR